MQYFRFIAKLIHFDMMRYIMCYLSRMIWNVFMPTFPIAFMDTD
jgi:hypothetical protein